MDPNELHIAIDSVILSIGDIVIDNVTGYLGILLFRHHRIDMLEDDVYVWEVKWISRMESHKDKANVFSIPEITIWEEEGMKLSILSGTCEWHSITGGTFEP
jgi:hypothetical protein